MRILLFVILTQVFLLGCGDENNKGFHTAIDREYELVIGLLSPDSTKTSEIFVGKLIDKVPSVLEVKGVQDPILKHYLLATQNNYIATLDYHNDATVTVRTGQQSVEFSFTQNGTYIDTNNALRVRAGEEYVLEVRRANGRIYTAKTVVPAEYNITTFSRQDTIISYPKKLAWDSLHVVQAPNFYHTPAAGAIVYVNQLIVQIADVQSGLQRYFLVSTEPKIPVTASASTEKEILYFKWEIQAQDTSMSRFLQALGGFGTVGGFGTPDFFEFYDYWNQNGRILERSNINGNGYKYVTGCFGSYNTLKTEFFVLALKDSIGCVYTDQTLTASVCQ
jgi:hypothetical protein